MLRGKCEYRWKMASEWCTEHGKGKWLWTWPNLPVLCKVATGTACYSGVVYDWKMVF
ncbi:hypothetical protein [Robinsoniella sp. KNHs210]|uniref:hypothetical protein n=1 Tax=Robinsoniella sp. KNHs210 TaxID=1469950 RepID=UPI003FA6E52E